MSPVKYENAFAKSENRNGFVMFFAQCLYKSHSTVTADNSRKAVNRTFSAPENEVLTDISTTAGLVTAFTSKSTR